VFCTAGIGRPDLEITQAVKPRRDWIWILVSGPAVTQSTHALGPPSSTVRPGGEGSQGLDQNGRVEAYAEVLESMGYESDVSLTQGRNIAISR
jgi:hypothetical protein